MARTGYVSLRLENSLKAELAKIADLEHRTLSNVVELLLARAVKRYESERTLIDVGVPEEGRARARRLDLDPEQPSSKKVAAKATSKR